jgi:2-oxoglutarate dehydrogenase E1 component
MFAAREKQYAETGMVDWATGEALALGSLLVEGTPIRFSGEDTRRGTFSQRHAALVDYETEKVFIPLAEMPERKAPFWVYDSLLSEYAALGYEGQGPEHSSARIERFLTLCAEDNIQVVYPTTARQYFHLLRRQARHVHRKPLIVFAPKSPLRMKEVMSHVDELTTGAFEEVLDDPFVADPASVTRIVFCSGKVAWDAMAERARREAPVAVVRVEQLYPFPQDALLAILARYENARDLVWLQEEPENMGPWHFIEHRTWRIKERGYDLRHVARVESGSPATGSKVIHDQELADLLEETFQSL